jgi:hypothetical protein
MSNMFLAWQNRTDEGVLSGGSWLSTLPLSNLQNRQVQKVARTTDDSNASTQFTIDLGSAKTIGVVALIVHNISVSGKVRVSASDTPGFVSTIYDSGWQLAWPAGVIPQALLEWEDDNFWLGTLSAQARAGYQSPYIWKLDNSQVLRYWKVEIDDTTNTDNFIQIGRLFMARGWTPTVNYGYGAGLGYQDPTPVDTSLSGAEYFDQRSKYRVMSFALPYVTGTEAYSYALELQRLAGVSGEVLVIPDPDTVSTQPIRSFVGRLRQIGAVAQPNPTTYSVNFEVKELL